MSETLNCSSMACIPIPTRVISSAMNFIRDTSTIRFLFGNDRYMKRGVYVITGRADFVRLLRKAESSPLRILAFT